MSIDPKSHSRERFSQYAQGYVFSNAHKDGGDLDEIVRLAEPQPGWVALDIATGGGHTALKLAPHVARMIASDYAPVMLEAAQRFITGKGLTNVDYVPADAENLPFRPETFDLITCRIAAHHFPDIFRFVQECARTLKPGGTLVVQDQALPEDKQDAAYIEAFETLRDPSHVRALPVYEWQGTFLDAGLTVGETLLVKRDAPMLEWAERQGCTPDVIEKLHVMMIQAPEGAARWMNIRCAGTPDAIFDHTHMILRGTKA
ncbi:MAG: class I SAM-dependent methyltransferase [Anaerolineae bacterium]|nr:class I SAM-dependent methyltransferase [Anaerolineae bacterium]NUQ04912.1 class I SAM-dependent methyltransferase [Anaerolineae bacterium]